MAHFWVRYDGEWAIAALDGDALVLGSWNGSSQEKSSADEPRVQRVDSGAGSGWVLLAGPDCDVSVNGLPLLAGIRLLADRDEIRVAGASPVYFSAEALARIEPLPDTGREVICPRCRQPIEKGTPAVRCPSSSCGVWHHESERFPCWTYAATCSLCPQPTDLEAGFQWTPEGI